MSFDSPFSDPAWVAIELYARVVDPLQLILEFPELPYVPFGQQQPRKGMPLRDVGDFRVKRQLLSIVQKQVCGEEKKRVGSSKTVPTAELENGRN